MFFFICSNEVAMNINSDERKILVSRKFGAKKGGYIFVRRDLFEKVDKNSGFTNCAASVFNHIAAGHGTRAFVGLLPAETRFSQSVTRSLWSKQLSRCFYRANTGLNQYPSFLPFLSFFHKVNENCTCRRRCVRSKRVSSIIEHCNCNWNTFLFYLWNLLFLLLPFLFIITLVRGFVSNFSLSLSLTTLSRWPEFRQVYRENMLLFDSLFFGIKVRNWVGSMNESQGLRVKEEVFKVYN